MRKRRRRNKRKWRMKSLKNEFQNTGSPEISRSLLPLVFAFILVPHPHPHPLAFCKELQV